MKARHLALIMFWLCFLGAHSVNAADEEIINGQVDKSSIKMVRGQLSDAQSIDIKEIPGINLINNADNSTIANNINNANNANPTLKPAKPATPGVSIIDKSDRSKKYFELSNKTSKAAWRKKKIAGAQSIDRKADIKQSRELQDMETKRKNMKASRKKSLELKPERKILKPNPGGKKNAS